MGMGHDCTILLFSSILNVLGLRGWAFVRAVG